MQSDSSVVIQPFLAPGEIEKRSFEIIDAEVPEPRPFAGKEWEIVRRLIHTTADFEMLSLVRFHKNAINAGLSALRAGCHIITDTEMAKKGIPYRRIDPLGCPCSCFMNEPDVVARAKRENITRALAAVDKAASIEGPTIFAIGNAPTALLRLLELIKERRIAPDLIVGMPVGFVNAAESKRLLISQTDIPYIAIEGRKGGSALAAATINALAEIALRGDG
jgi:precorrin-8X/cobalt-precorrin-8 methylmutase